MNKKTYQRLSVRIVTLHSEHDLLAGSDPLTTVPRAGFMSNPGIGDEDEDEDEV